MALIATFVRFLISVAPFRNQRTSYATSVENGGRISHVLPRPLPRKNVGRGGRMSSCHTYRIQPLIYMYF